MYISYLRMVLVKLLCVTLLLYIKRIHPPRALPAAAAMIHDVILFVTTSSSRKKKRESPRSAAAAICICSYDFTVQNISSSSYHTIKA